MKAPIEAKTRVGFIRFASQLIMRRPWHYAAGIVSVLILDAVDMLPSYLIKGLTDKVQSAPEEVSIPHYAAALMGCYLTISILRMSWRFFLMLPSRTLERELREEAYEKIVHGDYAHASRLKIGDVISTLSQDVGNIRMFMGPGILVMVDSIALLVFVPITLFIILKSQALYVMAPFVLLAVVVLWVRRPLEAGHQAISDKLGELSQYVYEETQGAKFFRAEGLIELRRRKYTVLLQLLFGRQMNITKYDLVLDGTLQTVIQTSYLIVLGLAFQGHAAGAQTLGTLTVSLQLLDKLLWPLMSATYLMALYQSGAAGAKRYQDIHILPGKVNGPEKIENVTAIEIKNLDLYNSQGEQILHQISLVLKPGEHVALVGEVGSGKSVVLQTLAGLWEDRYLKYETFTFNHVSFEALDRKTLWQRLSYIPQTPQIFSKSLASNISPHLPFEVAGLWEALEKADLAQDVRLLPDELSTLIGEKGMNLSGGQKSRTLIARSFHSKASLYLWDDVVAALDPATERKIIQSLKMLDANAILVLATHRLSSLKHFDRILIMDQGRITLEGTFEEIKRHHQLFAELLSQEQKALQSTEAVSTT